MGGCCCADDKAEFSMGHNPDRQRGSTRQPEFKSKQKHSCTDCICLIFFALFVTGMLIIGIFSYQLGSLNGTYYGYDSYGNACGFDNSQINNSRPNYEKQQYRLCFSYDNLIGALTGTAEKSRTQCICVKKCPSTSIAHDDIQAFIKYEQETSASYCYDFNKKADRWDGRNYGKNGPCPKMGKNGEILVETVPFLHRCLPEEQTTALLTVGGILMNLDYVQNALLSVYHTRVDIAISLGIAIGLSFLLIVLMRLLAGIVAFIITIGMCILMYLLAGGLWLLRFQPSILESVVVALKEVALKESKDIIAGGKFDSTVEKILGDSIDNDVILISAILVTIFAVLLTTFVCCMRSRTQISVELIKYASRVFIDVPLLFFTPLFVLIVLLIFWLVWTFVFLSIISYKNDPAETHGSSLILQPQLVPVYEYLKWYHLIGLFWMTEFILACHYLVIAGTSVQWYYRKKERSLTGKNKSCLSFPLVGSVVRVFLFHMGSAAFGSFLITLVQIPRAILLYVDRKLRQSDQNNGCVKFMLACMHCCLACVEKCLRYLTKNGYIMVMISSRNFCSSAGSAMELLASNVLQVGAIEAIGWAVFFMGRLVVATSSGCYVAFMLYMKEKSAFEKAMDNSNDIVPYRMVPILVATLAAYFIAKIFFGLFDMVVKTILLCFCKDTKENSGYMGDEYSMDGYLMTTMQRADRTLTRSR